MKFYIGNEEVDLKVDFFAEYPRGNDGLCALCHGDPCNEYSPPDSLIARWWKENESCASTCPVCGGRPS